MYRHGRKTKQFKPAKPFTGMINQLNRETLVLVTLDKFEGFREALNEKGIDYDLGDPYKGGIIVVKK